MCVCSWFEHVCAVLCSLNSSSGRGTFAVLCIDDDHHHHHHRHYNGQAKRLTDWQTNSHSASKAVATANDHCDHYCKARPIEQLNNGSWWHTASDSMSGQMGLEIRTATAEQILTSFHFKKRQPLLQNIKNDLALVFFVCCQLPPPVVRKSVGGKP